MIDPSTSAPRRRLGRLAIDAGWLSAEVLRRVLADQRVLQPPRYLGALLIEQGLLSPQQLTHLLDQQGVARLRCPATGQWFNVHGFTPGRRIASPVASAILEAPASPADAPHEVEGDLGLDEPRQATSFTEPAAAASRKLRRPRFGRLVVDLGFAPLEVVRNGLRIEAAEPDRHIGDVLVGLGAITPQQVRDVLRLQGVRIARDPSTGRLYNVHVEVAGPIRSPESSAELEWVKDPSAWKVDGDLGLEAVDREPLALLPVEPALIEASGVEVPPLQATAPDPLADAAAPASVVETGAEQAAEPFDEPSALTVSLAEPGSEPIAETGAEPFVETPPAHMDTADVGAADLGAADFGAADLGAADFGAADFDEVEPRMAADRPVVPAAHTQPSVATAQTADVEPTQAPELRKTDEHVGAPAAAMVPNAASAPERPATAFAAADARSSEVFAAPAQPATSETPTRPDQPPTPEQPTSPERSRRPEQPAAPERSTSSRPEFATAHAPAPTSAHAPAPKPAPRSAPEAAPKPAPAPVPAREPKVAIAGAGRRRSPAAWWSIWPWILAGAIVVAVIVAALS